MIIKKFFYIIVTVFAAVTASVSVNAVEIEEYALAELIEDAVGGEPYLAKASFGSMIINRTNDGRFPGNIVEAVNQYRNQNGISGGNRKISHQSESAAEFAISNSDITEGALYCCMDESLPENADITLIVGGCIFFR